MSVIMILWCEKINRSCWNIVPLTTINHTRRHTISTSFIKRRSLNSKEKYQFTHLFKRSFFCLSPCSLTWAQNDISVAFRYGHFGPLNAVVILPSDLCYLIDSCAHESRVIDQRNRSRFSRAEQRVLLVACFQTKNCSLIPEHLRNTDVKLNWPFNGFISLWSFWTT